MVRETLGSVRGACGAEDVPFSGGIESCEGSPEAAVGSDNQRVGHGDEIGCRGASCGRLLLAELVGGSGWNARNCFQVDVIGAVDHRSTQVADAWRECRFPRWAAHPDGSETETSCLGTERAGLLECRILRI